MHNSLFCAFEYYPSSPENIGSGHLLVNTQMNPIDILNDPASVVKFNRVHFGFEWGEKFRLITLNHQSTVIVGMLQNINISIGASTMGDEIYKETLLGLTFGKIINGKLLLGTSFMMYHLKIKEYGQDTRLGMNLGWRIALEKNIIWFGALRNITGQTIGQTEESLPQIISSGIIYDFSENIKVIAEWEQDTLYKSRWKYGGQFAVMPWLKVFTGHASSPDQFSTGFTIHFKNIKINYAFSTHSFLDISHYMGLGIAFP